MLISVKSQMTKIYSVVTW